MISFFQVGSKILGIFSMRPMFFFLQETRITTASVQIWPELSETRPAHFPWSLSGTLTQWNSLWNGARALTNRYHRSCGWKNVHWADPDPRARGGNQHRRDPHQSPPSRFYYLLEFGIQTTKNRSGSNLVGL